MTTSEPTTGEIVSALRNCPNCDDCLRKDQKCYRNDHDAADRLESQERTIAELTARAEQAEAREKAAIDLTAINIMRHIVKEDVDITKWNEPCVLCEHDYSDHGKCGSCDYDKNFELKYHLRGLPQDGEGK